MTAKEKFKLGQRIKPSAEGLEWSSIKKMHHKLSDAKVFNFRPYPYSIMVKARAWKDARPYHMDLWEPK